MEANLDCSECELMLATLETLGNIGDSNTDQDDANNNIDEDNVDCILDRTLWIGQLWPTVSERLDLRYIKDDADSGYHTGESTLRDHTPGELTLTREELRKNIDAFNDNQHGLIMTLNEETATFQGFIRVSMNLMRPISMSLPSRPTSIYDVVGSDCDSDEPPCETLTTSFYLPKDTTKVIHISSATTTQDVIKALLQKFKITDNPRKFALYEKMEIEGAKATMRRLLEEEKPLPLCLSWTAEGLESHKFVLQENEPGEIVWEAFSIPELENFLKILDREEGEYVDQMKAKYKLLRIQIERQMKTLLAEGETQSASCTAGPPSGSHTSFEGDSREPVYV